MTKGVFPILYNSPETMKNWYDAIFFCNQISAKYNLKPYYEINEKIKDPNNICEEDTFKYLVTINEKSNGFRLPTEAEWEFAARGGIKSKGYFFSGSNNLDEVGWYNENSNGESHKVGEKKPNELGINDMSGNVWEWCYDWFGEYDVKDIENPKGSKSGFGRVICGGSATEIAENCRPFSRLEKCPSNKSEFISFRLARNI